MLRAFFFVFFSATGIVVPFLGPYLRSFGFSGRQIALTLSIAPLLGLVLPLAWAWLADRTGRHVAVLRGLCLGVLSGALGLVYAEQPLTIVAALAWMAIFSGAIVPLADAMASATVQKSQRYARTRLWGSVGFAVTSLGGGLILTRSTGEHKDAMVPVLLAGAYALTALVALCLDAKPALGDRPRLRDMKLLLGDTRLRLVLVIAALHWGCGAPYTMLFGILVRDLGLSSSVAGAAFAVGVAVEIVVLHQFTRLAARFPRDRLLSVALGATVIRWMLVGHVQSAWALVALQAIHGLTFGLFWAVTVALVTEYVPQNLRASGQALLNTSLAAGNLAGYYAGGSLYDATRGAAIAFTVAGLVELLPFLLTFRFRALGALRPAA